MQDHQKTRQQLVEELSELRSRLEAMEAADWRRQQTENLLRVQRDLSVALSSTSNLLVALDRILEAAIQIEGIDCGGIYLVDQAAGELRLVVHRNLSTSFVERISHFGPEAPQTQLVLRGVPVYGRHTDFGSAMDEAGIREGLRSIGVIPIQHNAEVIAAINVASRCRDEIPLAARNALEAIVMQIAGVLIRVKSEEALRKEHMRLTALLDLHERERQLVAYEIHDGFVQEASGALMHFQTYEVLREQSHEEADQTFNTALRLLRESIDDARRLINGLRPPILNESGVIAAVEYLMGESNRLAGPRVELHHDVRFHRLPRPLESTIFRIVKECLANARRHSASDKVEVRLVERDQRLRIEVQDWGVGFDPENVPANHYGLEGIRQRASVFGGQAIIDSAPGKGTCVIVDLPLASAEDSRPGNPNVL